MKQAAAGVLLALVTLGSTVHEDPAQRRMLGIAVQLRCAVCQNESVAESHAPLAQDMRAVILERIAAGDTDAQIVDYFHQRYGDYVLMRPPVRGAGLGLWLAPGVLLVVAGTGAALYLRRRAREGTS